MYYKPFLLIYVLSILDARPVSPPKGCNFMPYLLGKSYSNKLTDAQITCRVRARKLAKYI